MGKDIVPRDQPAGDRAALSGLHPYVYAVIAALVLWFIVSVWSTFAGEAYTDYLLAVVSGFLLIFVALPFVLSLVSRDDDTDADSAGPQRTFRGWASCEFATWQYRLKCGHAAAEILLPVAAIAFGMTAFGVILLLVSHGTI
ncbi:MAG: hypothetical protein GEU95_04080 [Rhizobiales bacterium]|nr:hypothetical protein [Hyphomicrobiales bacterium]